MKIAADKFCILANQTSSTISAGEIVLPSQTTTLPPGNEVTGMGGAAAGDIQGEQPTTREERHVFDHNRCTTYSCTGYRHR